MLQILESGQALYALAAACVLGLLCRLTARTLYGRLMREVDNMALTKNRYLREFKQKAENTYRLNQGLHNTQAYLEKQLSAYRFMGISLNGWSNLSGQMTVLCFLLGGAAAFASYWYRCDNYYIVLYAATGILTGLLTLFLDFGVKRSQLLSSLQDYLENSLFCRLSRETAAAAEEGPRAVSRDNGLVRGGFRTGIRDNGRDSAGEAAAGRDGGESRPGREEAGARAGIRSIARNDRGERTEAGKGDNYQEEDRAAARAARRNSRLARKGQQEEPAEVQSQDPDYVKKGLEQIAASREKGRSDGEWIKELAPDELELIGEILKQYLA